MLFTPWARTFGGYLRPAIGATVNFNGDTSKAYADVRWEIETPSGVFFALGVGAAVHDGHLSADAPDRKALGSRVLFHPSAELGYRFDGANSISIFADHMSNGFTQRSNEALDTVGIRLGHRFGALVARETADIAVADFSGPYIGAAGGYQFDERGLACRLGCQLHDQRLRLCRLCRLQLAIRAGASSASRWMPPSPRAA